MTKILAPVLTFIGGLYFFLEFLLPETIPLPGDESGFTFGAYHQEITRGVVLISTMAVGLGVINLCMVHGRAIIRKSKGAIVSFFLLSSFIGTFAILSYSWYQNEVRQASWNSTLALMNYTKQERSKENISAEDLYHLRDKLKKNIGILQAQKKLPAGAEEKEYRTFFAELAETLNTPFVPEMIIPEDEVLTETEQGEAAIPDDPEILFLIQNINEAINEISIFRAANLAEAARLHQQGFVKKAESIIIHGLFFPLGLSMFSLLAFYIAYAAYRSFKVRSLESGIMMCAAFIVILGQIPQGVLYISSDLPAVRLWLMQYLSTPAMRAIYFSSAIAGLSIAVRMWLSIDKNPISSK
jgi:hypothetical protein